MTSRGLFLRKDAVARGYDDNMLGRLVRNGTLERIRQGAYASKPTWDAADDRDRHQLLCDAVVRQYPPHVALSHDSAVIRHGGPDYGLGLSQVHVTHFHGGGRRTAGVVHHEGNCSVMDVTRREGSWVTSPARTVLDVSMLHGVKTGVVVADDFIHRGLTSTDHLWMAYEGVERWPGALTVRVVIGLGTGRSESVGESLGMLLFRDQRLPWPVQQHEVFDRGGRLVGRSDWYWPDLGILGEFDGRQKYVRYLRDGETTADAVMREKRREDEMRELTGCRFFRMAWSDLYVPEKTAARFAQLANLRAA